MSLDARQRAMLREMGVRVWQPSDAAPAAAHEGPESVNDASAAPPPPPAPAPAPAPRASAEPPLRAQGSAPSRAAPATRPESPAAPSAAPNAAQSAAHSAAQGWQVGPPQALHPETASAADSGPRWLLLVEQRQDDGSGEAQHLLQAMLRAARLHQGSQVWLAPLYRSEPAGPVQGLEQALAGTEPDLVFIMGRLGAQALLETDEPLGRLRGQIHELWGLPALVSYDPVTLLRNPADKGKAWDDLCLALPLARQQYEERRASQAD